jgi:hypothetical protein
MIYVKVDGKEHGITFLHEKNKVEVVNKAGKKVDMDVPFKTTCAIIDPESKATIATGVAKVDSRDNFTYNKGRKFSLKNALLAANMHRHQRTQLWNQFFEKVKY